MSRKNGNGAGNFYQRKAGGPWYFRISLGKDSEGKSVRKQYGPYRTKTEARQQHDQLREQVRRGERSVERGNVTLGEYLETWTEGLKVNRSLSTQEFYGSNLRRYVLPHLASVRLDQLTGTDLTKLYARLLADGGYGKPLSPTTVRHIHTTLNTALRQAVRDGLLLKTPTASANAPTAKATKKDAISDWQVWTPEQVRTFLEHVRDDWQYALWRLALTTGRRRGELLGLRWRNVDLDSSPPTIRIVEQRGFVPAHGIQEGATKTTGSAGTISLDQSTAEALRAQQRQQQEWYRLLDGQWSAQLHVFTNPDGTPVYPPRTSRRFLRLVETSNLPRIRFHDLRHTYATCALASGIPVKVVSQRLGHADINITLSTYAHVLPQHDADAAESVAALFG